MAARNCKLLYPGHDFSQFNPNQMNSGGKFKYKRLYEWNAVFVG